MTDKDQLKTSLGAWVEIFRNNLQGQEGKGIFPKRKKVLIKKYTKYIIPFTALQIASQISFLALR